MEQQMNQQNDKKYDKKLIILGLTGPVGSGCTEFSKIFDADGVDENPERNINKNELFKFLSEKRKYIKIDENEKKVIPIHKEIDGKIECLFKKIKQMDDEINKTELKRKIFSELKEKLEVRETLKSLDGLKDCINFFKENPPKHDFRRISVADVIIFNALIFTKYADRFIKDAGKNHRNKKKRERISKFQKIVKKKQVSDKIDQILKKIKAKSLRKIESLLSGSKTYTPEQIVEVLMSTVEVVREIKQELQKLPEYRTIMQDLGDNIRRTGNPFNYSKRVKPERIRDGAIHQKLAKDVDRLIKLLHDKG